MKPIENFNEIEENIEFCRIPAGGYICKITSAEDVPQKEYLKLEFDVIEGEYKGYFMNLLERAGWTTALIKSYKAKAAAFFKGFITSVTESNPGFTWDWDEKKLIGQTIGIVLGEEEYEKKDGSVGDRLYVARVTSTANIALGNYETPRKKILFNGEPAAAPTFKTATPPPAELPF